MKRYRVRAGSKEYTDKGPDLLRTKDTATQSFANTLGSNRTGLFTRRKPPNRPWYAFAGPMPRVEVLQRAAGFMSAPDNARFQVARRKKNGEWVILGEMKVVEVPHVDMSGVHAGAEMVADLARVQFPGINIGGFVCKEYNSVPGSGWSDHAWGDAVDLVVPGAHSPGENDVVTDWCVRMAKEQCMGLVSQFIGSIKGRVYSFAAPTYAANLGGPTSHLTHCHCSYNQHYGKDPNCR